MQHGDVYGIAIVTLAIVCDKQIVVITFHTIRNLSVVFIDTRQIQLYVVVVMLFGAIVDSRREESPD